MAGAVPQGHAARPPREDPLKLREVLAALPGLTETLQPDGLSREVEHAYFELAAGKERLRLRYRDGLERDLDLAVGTVAAVLAAHRERLDLVRRAGKPGFCRGCHAPVFWIQHLGEAARTQPSRRANEGPWVPYSASGRNHFIDCPQRREFRRGEA
ncbi:MAG: hypothetical protein EYC70_00350 [Planctomycetota bacterium]|nr:MAG: hypothetical protein EYC70_00350 [Planctomycetota bacterium]